MPILNRLWSIDGIGAFDLISRASMLTALKNAQDVTEPFRCPSSFFSEDEDGTNHKILQVRGERTGGTPSCQHCSHRGSTGPSLLRRQECIRHHGFFDDVKIVTNPARVADSFAHLERSLWEHASIRLNMGNFNRGTFCPWVPTHLARREVIEPSSHRVAVRFIIAAKAAGGPCWEHPSDMWNS